MTARGGALDHLVASGLRPSSAGAILDLYQAAADAMDRAAAAPGGRRAWFVPGRIEVLGKHTDYCGGRSLLCATERGFVAIAAPRRDSGVRVQDAHSGEVCAFDLGHPPAVPAADGDLPWRTYPAAVVRRLGRNFPRASRGADIAFASNLPPASGLSSSSALVIAVAMALIHVNDLEAVEAFRANVASPEALAGYVATMENGAAFGALEGEPGVGTFGGSQDHTAILCCRPGRLSQYAFAPTRFEADVAMPAGQVFVVCASGAAAVKTATAREAYNRAALSARTVLDLWNRAQGRCDPTLAAAADSGQDAVSRMHEAIDRAPSAPYSRALLHERLEQFEQEGLRLVPAATAALRDGRLDLFGPIVDRSQEAAERGLHNQIEETVALARLAREEGAVAASAFGAGFGGSVWALVGADAVAEFADRWRRRYLARFPSRAPAIFDTGAAPAAMRLRAG